MSKVKYRVREYSPTSAQQGGCQGISLAKLPNFCARIRRIADLDYQHLGIPKEETYRQFNYDDPIKKNQ